MLRDPQLRTSNGHSTFPRLATGDLCLFPIAAVFLFSSRLSALYQYNRFDLCGRILVCVEFLAPAFSIECTHTATCTTIILLLWIPRMNHIRGHEI